MSTPRSGTNLLASTLAALTGRPVLCLHSMVVDLDKANALYKNHPSYNRMGVDIIEEMPIVLRTHYTGNEKKLVSLLSLNNKLILLIRNPKELFLRDFFKNKIFTESLFRAFVENFYEKIKAFEAWNSDNRILIYYEDLIDNPREIALRILEFCKIKPLFLDVYDINRALYEQTCLDSYKKQHPGSGVSLTNGKDKLFYSKHFENDVMIVLDEILKSSDPILFEKYLSRFKESKAS